MLLHSKHLRGFREDFDYPPQNCSHLTNRRLMRGLSQEVFADICGLDRTYVGGIERGERNVALVNVEKIAKAFKLSVSELLEGI